MLDAPGPLGSAELCRAQQPGGPWAEAALPPVCARGDVDAHSHILAALLT